MNNFGRWFSVILQILIKVAGIVLLFVPGTRSLFSVKWRYVLLFVVAVFIVDSRLGVFALIACLTLMNIERRRRHFEADYQWIDDRF